VECDERHASEQERKGGDEKCRLEKGDNRKRKNDDGEQFRLGLER
jgi:hypothetical protein